MTYFWLRSSKWAIKVNTTDASIVYSCSDMCKSWILSWVGVYTLQITGMNSAWQGLTLLWKHWSLTGSLYMSTFESNFCPQAPCPLFHQVFSMDASKWFNPLVLVRSQCRVALRAHKWRSCDWAVNTQGCWRRDARSEVGVWGCWGENLLFSHPGVALCFTWSAEEQL